VREHGASAVDCGCLLPLCGGGSLLPVARSRARTNLLHAARSTLRPPQKLRPAAAVQGLAALIRRTPAVGNHPCTHF